MLTHRGFSAWIVANGEILPEYLVAVDEVAHRVSCWIPGEAGQTFAVYWQDHGSQVDTCAYITLDGILVPGRFLFGDGVAFRQGLRTGKNHERPFQFQNVGEFDEQVQSVRSSKDVGMITLKIKRVKRVGGQAANPIQPSPDTFSGKRKADNLRVGFGTEMPTYEQHDTTWAVIPYDDDGSNSNIPKTYLSFVFRYRTREFLEAQGIIPESEQPAPLPVFPQKVPFRRVVSLPVDTPPGTDLPEFSQKKKAAVNSTHSHPSSHTSPADLRRSLSWKVIPTNTAAFPGQSIILFDTSNAESSTPDQLNNPVPQDNSNSHFFPPW